MIGLPIASENEQSGMSNESHEGSGTNPGNASSDTIQQVKLLCRRNLMRADVRTIQGLAKMDPDGVLSALAQSDSDSMPNALLLLMGQLQLVKAREVEPLDHCIKLAHKHVSQFPDDVSSVRPFLRDVLLMQDEVHVGAVDSIFSMLPPTLTVVSHRALWASLWLPQRAREAANQLREEIAAVRQQHFLPLLQQDQGFAELVALISSARNIAIVGSGPSLQGAGQGAKIDAHDLVVRINFAPMGGSFAEDIGSRVDAVFTWPAPTSSLFKNAIVRHENYRRALVVQAVMSKRHHTAFSADDLAEAGVSRFIRLPLQVWKPTLDLSYPYLTMGFGAILFIALLLNRPVSLFGFDFFETERRHFWEAKGPSYWPRHEPRFEKRMVEKLLKIHFGVV